MDRMIELRPIKPCTTQSRAGRIRAALPTTGVEPLEKFQKLREKYLIYK